MRSQVDRLKPQYSLQNCRGELEGCPFEGVFHTHFRRNDSRDTSLWLNKIEGESEMNTHKVRLWGFQKRFKVGIQDSDKDTHAHSEHTPATVHPPRATGLNDRYMVHGAHTTCCRLKYRMVAKTIQPAHPLLTPPHPKAYTPKPSHTSQIHLLLPRAASASPPRPPWRDTDQPDRLC